MRELILNEGKDAVSLHQLLMLGVGLEQAGGDVTFILHERLPEAYYSNGLSKLTIRADYWISWLLTNFEKMESPNELNWLIASAKFLQVRGETEMVRRIKAIIPVLEEPSLFTDLPADRTNSFLYLWLEDFLTNYADTPWVIYTGKKKSAKVERDVELAESQDNGQQDVAPAQKSLKLLLQQDTVTHDSLSQTNKVNNKSFIMKKILLKGLKNFGLGGSTALLEVLNNAKGCILCATLDCKDLLNKAPRQEVDDVEIKGIKQIQKARKVPKVLYLIEKFKVKKTVKGFWNNKYVKAYINPGLGLTIWDAYDAGRTLANPSSTAKENRDAIATFTFISGELVSTGALAALSASTGVGIIVSVGWTVGAFVYSGFSMLYEYWDENFSAWERYVTYSRGFMQMDLHPNLQEYLGHRQILNQRASDVYSLLQEKPDIYFIASSIGEYNKKLLSFKEFVTEKYGEIRARALFPRIYFKHEDTGYHKVDPAIDPIPYRKEYEAYVLDNMILPGPINIAFGKNELRKISRLTPNLPGKDAILFCGPNFREDEPPSTSTGTRSRWSCDNSFIIGRPFSQDLVSKIGVFDLSLASAGQVKLDNKVDFESEFYLGNNSTIVINAPRSNSPPSQFFLPTEAFSGTLIGDPNYAFTSNTVSTIIASQVNKKNRIELNNDDIVFRETATNNAISSGKFYHIQVYIGHAGPDHIDCKTTNIKIVDTKGGSAENVDYLSNCNQGFVSSYTHIRNDESSPAYYTIKPDSSHIEMHLLNKSTVIKLSESIVTFLKNYEFQLDLENNILIIKKNGRNNYLLKVVDYIRLDSVIQFVDIDKIAITPHFVINETEEETRSIANEFHYIMQDTDRQSALAKHLAIVENNPDKQILGQSYYPNRNIAKPPQAILGTKGNDLFLIEPTDVDYVAGNEGADIYKIKKKESTFPTITTIDNYSPSLSPEIDEIHLPFSNDKISCQRTDTLDNDLLCRDNDNTELRFKNALAGAASQHFFFVDKDNKGFIPMYLINNDKVDLIPYYSIHQVDRFPEIEFDTRDPSSPLQVAIEGDLPTSFRLYRDWNRVSFVGYGQDGVNVNLLVSIPIEQFKSTTALQIFSTHHATAVSERTDSMTLNLGDYYPLVVDRTSLVQIDRYIHKYEITFKNLRFDDSIETTIEISAQQLAYLSLDQAPRDVEFKSNKNDLLIILYNDQLQMSKIKVVNGLDPAQRLEGIIVKGKLLPISLAEETFDDESLEALTSVFRINLIQQWIKEQLNLIPFQLTQEALFKILAYISRYNSLQKAIDFFQKINLQQGLEKEEIITFFGDNILVHKKEKTFTPEKQKEIEKATLLIYASHVLQSAEFDYTNVAYPFLSQAVHNLLFKDFESMLSRNFLLLNEKIQTHLLDPYTALNAFFDIVSEEKKQSLVKRYPFKLEELVRDNNREEVISHNQDSSNYKIGEIELDDLPLWGEYTLDGFDALLTVYKNKNQRGKLRITGWNELHHRMERIVIKDKAIPITLTLSPESREASTKLLRRHLVDLWIKEKLADVLPVAKKKALFKVIEQIDQTSSLEKALDLYSLWGYNSKEDLRIFYEGYSLKELTDEAENEAASTFILYYTQVLAFFPNYFEDFSKLIPERWHDFFSSALFQSNYSLTEIVRFRDTLFSTSMLRKVIPKITASSKEYYKYEIGNNQFFEKKTDIILYYNPDPNDIRLGYLYFDTYPADFKAAESNDDLLLILYNDKGQSRTIRIMNWRNALNRLQYIIVAGKKLFTHLAYFPLEQSSLDELTVKLRLNLLNEWLDAELNTLDYKSKSSIIVPFAEQLLASSLYKADRGYEPFGFGSAESFLQFYKNERKKTQNAYLTKIEFLNRQKATLLYYAKFYIEYPKDIHIFRDIVSKGVHDIIFEKDFWMNITVDFLRVSKQFKKNLFSLVPETYEHSSEIPQKNKKFDTSMRLREAKNRYSNVIRYTFLPKTRSIIHHNQVEKIQLGVESWITEVEEKRKKFFIDLGEVSEETPSIRTVSIARENNDLSLTFMFDWDGKQNTLLTFKNYDNPAHRINGIIANNQIIFDGLEFIRIEDRASLERIFNAAVIKFQAQKQRQRILKDSKDEFILKGYLISQALIQSRRDLRALATAFGFNSPRQLMEFHRDYLTAYSQENISTHPVHRIYEDTGEFEFLRLIYLHVMEASPTPLTIDQLQQAFPSLNKALLREFVEAYRTVPTANLTPQDRAIALSDKLAATISAELQKAADAAISMPRRIIKVPQGNQPYNFSGNACGFKEIVYLDLAGIPYDEVFFTIYNGVPIIRTLLEDRVTKKIKLKDWSNPYFQLSGLTDTNKNWTINFPRVDGVNELRQYVRYIQSTLVNKVKEASRPKVSAQQVNVHSLEARRYLEKNVTNNSQKKERGWLQTMGDWIYEKRFTLLKVGGGVVGGGVALGGAILAASKLHVGTVLNRLGMSIVGYIAVSTVPETQAEEQVMVPNLMLPNSDFETYSSEKGKPLLSFDNTTQKEGLNETSSRRTDFSGLGFLVKENLLLTDFLVRNYVTEEKHKVYIGDCSVERQYERRLEEVERMIPPVVLDEDWPSRWFAFEGASYFTDERADEDEDDTLFSIRNLFAQENDGSIKTKPQKKTMNSNTEERLA